MNLVTSDEEGCKPTQRSTIEPTVGSGDVLLVVSHSRSEEWRTGDVLVARACAQVLRKVNVPTRRDRHAPRRYNIPF